MNRSRIVVLILILTLLGGYVYFYEIQRGKKPEKTEKIFSFQQDNVEEIMLTLRDRAVSFKQENGRWRMEKPFQRLVENEKIHDLLSVFNYGIVEVIEENPQEYSQYGLEQPEIELGIRLRGDATFRTLLIGRDNPMHVCCYARVKGQRQVLLIGIGYKRELSQKWSYYISKRG